MPDRYVLDTSVAIRWYVDQPGSEHARELRDAGVEFVAPAVLRWEIANVLRKKGVLVGLLTKADVVAALLDLPALEVTITEDDLTSTVAALQLSLRHRLDLWDAAFVLMALQTGLTLLTADARLARGAAGLISTELLRRSQPVPGAS